MNRRKMLCWTGTVGTLAVAGCLAEEPQDGTREADDPTAGTGDESTPEPDDGPDAESGESAPVSDPAETVRAFFAAIDDADVAAVNAHVHEDGNFPPMTDEDAEELANSTFDATEIETVERTDEAATVELSLAVESEHGSEGPRPHEVELRAENADWKVWDVRDATADIAPAVSFDIQHDEDALEIVHTGGDSVAADSLSVRGEGLEATGNWRDLGGDINGDDGAITAGDRLTVGVEREYNLVLVWEDPDGEASVTLQSVAGASESGSESAAEEAPPAVHEHLQDAPNYDGTLADHTDDDRVTVLTGARDDGGEFVFLSPAIRVDPGTTVTWEVVDDSAHSVTATDGAFDSGVFSGQGETWSHTFTEPGIHLYECTPHRSLGQKGAVVVGEE